MSRVSTLAVRRPDPVPATTHGSNMTTGRYEALSARIRERTAVVGVIGLGYVGLPLAGTFAGRRLPGPRLRHRPGQGRAAAHAARATSATSRRRASGRCSAARFEATDRLRPARRGRRDRHLRPDAADRRPRAGPVVRRGLGAVDRRDPARRASSSSWRAPPTRAPPRRRAPPILEASRAEGRGGLLPGVQPGARGPRQRRLLDARPSPRWSAGWTQQSRRPGLRAVRGGRRRGGAGVRRRRWRRRARSWRTPTGR